MTSKNIFAIVLVTAVIFGGCGFFYGKSFSGNGSGKLTSTLSKTNISDKDCLEKARARLKESGFGMMPDNMEIKSVNGEVKVIKGDKITLKIRPLEPLADENLDERIISINNQTKIYEMVQKDSKLFQAEMDEYNKKMQEQMKAMDPSKPVDPTKIIEPLMPPQSFDKKEIKIDAIKVGSQITVQSEKDLKNEKNITAQEIVVQQNMAPIAPMADMNTPVPPIAPNTDLPVPPTNTPAPQVAAPAPAPIK